MMRARRVVEVRMRGMVVVLVWCWTLVKNTTLINRLSPAKLMM